MNRALAACLSCGFVTRRHSHIGAGGRCPKCRRPLTEISLTEARRLALERRGRQPPHRSTAELGDGVE
jgi:bacterioferritin-associated ferredoxin